MLNKDKNLLNYACGLRKIKKNKLDIELDLILQLLNAGAARPGSMGGYPLLQKILAGSFSDFGEIC